jgi:ankyrin repeat protein
MLGKVDIAQQLMDGGADVNVKNENGYSPLHKAAFWGRPGIAKLLIEHGADINAENNAGATPLKVAINSNKTEVADLLRQHGAKFTEIETEALQKLLKKSF